MNKKIIWGVIVIVMLIVAFWLVYPAFNVKEVNDSIPKTNVNSETDEESEDGPDSTVLAGEKDSDVMYTGEFIAADHDVEGIAKIIEIDGQKILRFENFETINGPDLRIYLSTGLDVEDSIDLGEIKGTKGNINYELRNDLDLEKYDKVLVWCRAFRVLFSYADLEST